LEDFALQQGHEKLRAVERPAEAAPERVRLLEHVHRAEDGSEHAHLHDVGRIEVGRIGERVTRRVGAARRGFEAGTREESARGVIEVEERDAPAHRAVEEELLAVDRELVGRGDLREGGDLRILDDDGNGDSHDASGLSARVRLGWILGA
jgi:hypothetical protein